MQKNKGELRGANHAEAVVAVAVVRVVVVTVGNGAVAGVVVPTAATLHTVTTGRRPSFFRTCLQHKPVRSC